MKNKNQRRIQPFFEMPEWWEEHWQGMPEYIQENKLAYKSLIVSFKNKEDMNEFAKLINQKINFKTKFLWHPKAKPGHIMDKIYVNKKMEENKNES